jgi:hypothetical protein
MPAHRQSQARIRTRPPRGTRRRQLRGYLRQQRDARTRLPELDWPSNGRRATTIYSYAAVLDELLRFSDETPLSRLRLDDLERFLMLPCRKARGRTLRQALSREATTLRSIYAYLQQRGHLQRNPAIFLTAPKRPRRDPRPPTRSLTRLDHPFGVRTSALDPRRQPPGASPATLSPLRRHGVRPAGCQSLDSYILLELC